MITGNHLEEARLQYYEARKLLKVPFPHSDPFSEYK